MASDIYNTYANYPCRDIPPEYMKQFILTFLFEASKDMGVVLEKEILPDRVYYIINTHYNHLPLNLVASACKRGGLGQYGAGRLVARTVFGWLGEINQYYLTVENKKDESYYGNTEKFKGLEKYPLGKAICWKIDRVKSGAMDIADWERVPLKSVAESLGRGGMPSLEDFGIESKI